MQDQTVRRESRATSDPASAQLGSVTRSHVADIKRDTPWNTFLMGEWDASTHAATVLFVLFSSGPRSDFITVNNFPCDAFFAELLVDTTKTFVFFLLRLRRWMYSNSVIITPRVYFMNETNFKRLTLRYRSTINLNLLSFTLRVTKWICVLSRSNKRIIKGLIFKPRNQFFQ